MTIEERKIDGFLSSVRTEMFAIMDRRNMNATGRSRAMIEYNVQDNKGILLGPDHIEFMERGRKPGGFPPLKEIQDWCIARGIPVQAAYPIALTIAKKGTLLHRRGERTGILSSTITPKRLEAFAKEYLEEKGIEILGRYAAQLKD